MTAYVQVPDRGAEGPICVMGGDTNGWSLYVKDGKPAYCYNLAGAEITTIRSSEALTPGPRADPNGDDQAVTPEGRGDISPREPRSAR
jgi:hypothetical protein